MSLSKQMALLFAAVWVLAMVLGLTLTYWGLREALREDVQLHAFIATATALALLGVAAAALAAWLLRRWTLTLQRTVEQAQAAAQGSFKQLDEPRAPELRQLARSVNAMTQRLATLFDTAATQVGELQRRAHLDAITNLPNRRHFVGRLQATLAQSQAHARGLLLLRLVDLAGLNARLGHDKVDQLLAALGEVLAAYPQRVPDTMAGRLNGADFALALPVAGITQETGEVLLMALRTAAAAVLGLPSASAPVVAWVIGGVDMRLGCTASEALAAADAALAEAETQGPSALVVHAMAEAQGTPLGARAWRAGLARALQDKQVRLAQTAVCDAQGKLIHQHCELELPLSEGGPYEGARRWLGMASRSRLSAKLDLCALERAVAASAADGQARCLRVAAATLGAESFSQELALLLRRHAAGAQHVRVELDARAIVGAAASLPAVLAVLREHGARLGLEHAGQDLSGEVLATGTLLSHITLRAHLVHGAANDHAVQDLARGLVRFAHGLGALALVEGGASLPDEAALWAAGVDGIARAAQDPQANPPANA